MLEAALRQGVALPYGCRSGACRSCRARVLEGAVHYPQGPPKALQPSDRDDGFVLLCAAHLRAGARIEVEELDDAQGDIVVRTLLCRLAEKEILAHDVVALRLRLQEGRAAPLPRRPVRRHRAAGRPPARLLAREPARRGVSLRAPDPARAGGRVLRLRVRASEAPGDPAPARSPRQLLPAQDSPASGGADGGRDRLRSHQEHRRGRPERRLRAPDAPLLGRARPEGPLPRRARPVLGTRARPLPLHPRCSPSPPRSVHGGGEPGSCTRRSSRTFRTSPAGAPT